MARLRRLVLCCLLIMLPAVGVADILSVQDSGSEDWDDIYGSTLVYHPGAGDRKHRDWPHTEFNHIWGGPWSSADLTSSGASGSAGGAGAGPETWVKVGDLRGATVNAMCWWGGRMWVATTGPLLECTDAGCAEHPEQIDISGLAGDRQGRLWAAPADLDPLWLYQSGAWRRNSGGVGHMMSKAVTGTSCYDTTWVRPELEVDNGVPWLPPAASSCLTVDANDDLWVLYRIDPVSHTTLQFDGEQLWCWDDEAARSDYALDIVAAPAGGVLISTLGKPDQESGSVRRFRGGSWTRIASPALYRLAVAPGGAIWGLGYLHLFRLTGSEWLAVSALGNWVSGPAADPSGGVWAVEGGVWQVVHVGADRPDVYPYPYERSHDESPTAIAVDGQGRPWVGDSRGVFRLTSATRVGRTTWGQVKGSPRR